VNIDDYDIISIKEGVGESLHRSKYAFFSTTSVAEPQYVVGSIFLVIRRRKKVNVGFGDRSFKKEFEEIVLSPDGRIGVMDVVRKKKIA
jgi:hypothetical protein